ncbi:AraC family transcriptional regulator ligand-binding domain-containing protein, partial [Streptomyces sp. NPDC050564]|uniref:AraC family transcriptional regulator ligand-binding domain-containing protein n=1 Tax=Streptomyces sp. NPDC050564 TaxID=3365631 RepID=UPI0037AB299F
MRPLARTAALNGYVELSRSLGLDPRVLMKGVGLDTADLAVQDRWISGTAVVRLLELSAAASGREDFGLLLAELRRFSNLGPISLLVREEPDVRSALSLLIRHQHTYNEVLHARLSEGNGVATLKVDLRLGEPQPARQGTELAVGAFHRVLCGFLGPRWRPSWGGGGAPPPPGPPPPPPPRGGGGGGGARGGGGGGAPPGPAP